MQKYYCYVDETGQDTKGKMFLVSVVVLEKDREAFRNKLNEIEKESGKGARKWFKTNKERRLKYVKLILEKGLFKHSIFFSKYEDTKAYVDLTIFSTAKAILQKATTPYEVTVLVDGLGNRERDNFAVGLRRLKVTVRKVRGVRDESDAFIRLADSIAGFVRDSLEGDTEAKKLFVEISNKAVIKEI